MSVFKHKILEVDYEGNHLLLLKDIIYHCKDDSSIKNTDGFLTSKSGKLHAEKTTRGWTLHLEWNYGSVDLVTLKDIKQTNPIDLVEYTIENQIQEEPELN